MPNAGMYRKAAQMKGTTKVDPNKVGKVMHEFKMGDLNMGKSGKMVKSKKQAIAIALSSARKGK